MKKFSKYFFGFAAAAMMFSCSSDEPATGGDNTNTGNDLYMNIKIKNAQGSMPSMGKGTAGGYEFGDSKLGENKISSAHFYFYDAQGNFLVESRLGALNGAGNKPDNVELITESAIVLQGLKEDELPAYMITVLNAPAGFNPGTTMAATAAAASSIKSNDNFVMSTSSFFNGNTALYDNNYPYANRLTSDNFKKSKEEALETGVPVEVYVERLAAKFEITGIDDEGFSEVRVTVAGNDNGDISGDYPEAGTKLYVKFDNWGVTNTEVESNMCKNILGTGVTGWNYSSTATTINGFNWNVPGDYRSYWGASRSYGQANPTLNHLTHATVAAPINSPVYCNETTNTKENTSIAAGTVNINNVTCVLLTATLYEDVEGVKKPVEDMVLYRGIYYKHDQFIKYLLQNVEDKQPNKELNFYICDDATKPVGERTFTQVGPEDMVLYQPAKPAVTGAVRVKLNSDETVLYSRSKKEDGTYEYTEIDNGTAELAKVLDTFFSMGDNNGEYQAIGYKGGAMFYTIPVEHLIAKSATAVKYAVENEGNYGVVRNHVYKINVKSVAKIGHGIFTPGEGGEVLIPDNPNDDRFNLGAEINILSWKVVSQDVDL